MVIKFGGDYVKLKKGLWLSLIIIFLLAIVSYAGYRVYINSYGKISDETKEKSILIIKGNKGQTPNLQTESCRASWTNEAHNKQKEMMDKVLDNLNVIGESRKGKPDKYIIATFYKKMQVYIPYNEKEPYKHIIIEADNHYYIATANREDINAIIDYMKKQQVIDNN